MILESVEGQGKGIDTYSCISSKYKEDFVVAFFCLDHCEWKVKSNMIKKVAHEMIITEKK